MNKYAIIFPFFFFCIYTTSKAQEAQKSYPIDIRLQKCIEADGSTVSMVECTQKAQKEWDNELNKYYKLLLAKLSVTEQVTLRESQRQWLVYKEKETKFFTKVYGSQEGSMWDVAIEDRKLNIIRTRAIEFIDYYETLTQH